MGTESSQWLPILSLCVALLAVFVGPFISYIVSKHQSETSLHVANKQIIAPMRQAWIELLRNRVAEILSASLWYYVSGQDENIISGENDEENNIESQKLERKLLFITSQIELMLNPNEDDHIELLKSLKKAQQVMWPYSKSSSEFPEHHKKTTELCQKVLKREWERVKNEI